MAPASSSACGAPLREWTWRAWPPATKCWAMGAPMTPSPMHPILLMASSPVSAACPGGCLGCFQSGDFARSRCEVVAQSLGRVAEKSLVHPHRDEGRAFFQVPARVLFHRRQDADGLVGAIGRLVD